jgi:hypothetical protein
VKEAVLQGKRYELEKSRARRAQLVERKDGEEKE